MSAGSSSPFVLVLSIALSPLPPDRECEWEWEWWEWEGVGRGAGADGAGTGAVVVEDVRGRNRRVTGGLRGVSNCKGLDAGCEWDGASAPLRLRRAFSCPLPLPLRLIAS